MNDNNGKAFAVSGLVSGILGLCLFLAPYIGIFFSVYSIVASSLQKKRGVDHFSGANLVLGILGVIINFVMLVFMIIALVVIY